MRTVYVNLSTTERIQDFVGVLTELEGDFELISDGFILDGRSLMGIFGLDRTKPIQLNIHNKTCDIPVELDSF